MPSPFEFKRYGRNGIEVSELLPQLASVVDEMCVIRSMYTFNPTHTPARACSTPAACWPRGRRSDRGFPTAWAPRTRICRRSSRWRARVGRMTRSGFLPSEYQGVVFPMNDPDPEKMIPNLRNKNVDAERAAGRHGRAARAEPELHEVVRRRISFSRAASRRWRPRTGCSSRRWISSTSGRSRRASATSTARRRSATAACWRGGWSKPACASSTWTTRAARSGTTTGTSTRTCASAARTWTRRRRR